MGAMSLEFQVLGPLEATHDGVPLVLGGTKQEQVLAALLLDANRVVSVDRLIEWVWGDDAGDTSAGTLQVYISKIRRLLTPAAEQLGRPVLVTQRPGYLMRLEPGQLDLLRFEALRTAGERAMATGDHAMAASALREAIGLWRGTPLAGLPLDPGAETAVTRIEVALVTTREQLAEAEMGLGRHREVVNELRAWVSEHSLNERLRALLMLALYRCGWQAEALAAYREGREQLVEELGIDPSRELRELEQRILEQDPSLDMAVAAIPFDPMAIESTVYRSSIIAIPAHVTVEGQVIGLDRLVSTIGRRPDRDIALSNPGVSRAHAEIRRSGDAYVLVDTASANGTTVNGDRIRERELTDGDVIRVGDTELVFRLGSGA